MVEGAGRPARCPEIRMSIGKEKRRPPSKDGARKNDVQTGRQFQAGEAPRGDCLTEQRVQSRIRESVIGWEEGGSERTEKCKKRDKTWLMFQGLTKFSALYTLPSQEWSLAE
jgi:hypothetical protein